ncbi:MAG: amidohydrolase family protein [Gemmataceae bacterium]
MSPPDPLTYTARWVFPVAAPPLAGGTVTVRGDRIEAVDPAGARTPDVDLGNVAVIPGLVNGHTHLDLSGARGRTPPTDAAHFTDWLRSVIAYRRSRTPEQVQADIRAGLAECLRTGTTLLGDIAADGQSWDAVAAAPVRAVVFRELIGLRERPVVEDLQLMLRWRDERTGRPTCRPGLSPHAPYSARALLIAVACRSPGLPVTVHWLESPAEAELIARRSGPFVRFLQDLGVWDEPQLIASHRECLVHASRAVPQLLLAHGNYLPPEDVIRPHKTTVVYCPRTHAAFGHPPHPFRQFLARGVRVCLGTDGLSSNPDLDLLAEARFVHARHPDFPGDALLKMATLAGAEGLGWADETGSLEAGKSADLVAVPLPDREAADPHGLLFSADAPAGGRRTMFRGQWRKGSDPP